MPVLATKRLVLRPLVYEDAESLLPALGTDENMRYWSRGKLSSVDEVRSYISYNVEGEGVECFAVTHQTDRAMGWVVLIDRRPGVAELGYILRPDCQGQGFCGEAVQRVMTYAFTERGLRRVFADVDPDNQRSRRLLTKLGFVYEGRLRATWDTHLGIRDSLIYSVLSTD